MKRCLSFLLSAVLLTGLVSGCTGDQGTAEGGKNAPMGRYMEEQGERLEQISEIYDFQAAPGGGFTFFGMTAATQASGTAQYRFYTVPAGGGPITSEEVAGLNEFAPNGIRSIARSADGSVYILYLLDEGFRTQVAKSTNGGAFASLAVTDLAADAPGMSGGSGGAVAESSGGVTAKGSVTFEGSNSVSGAASGGTFVYEGETGDSPKVASGILALEGGGFLLLYGEKGVGRYADDGTRQGEYPGTAFSFRTALNGDTLILGSNDGASLWSYDLATGKQNGTYTFDNLTLDSRLSLDKENLYLANSSGIYRQAKGSTLWEKLVEGDLTSLIMPNLSISGFAPDGSGGFGALLAGEDTVQHMRYAYSATTPTNPDTELSIFGLHDNSTVRQAIGEFQRRNPNVRVNFRIGLEDESSATTEDVIRSLNTELLAGKGPDLLLLDGLNVDTYIEKNVLSDLTDQIKGQGDLLPNLLNAYEKDGKRYGIASRFTFPVMMGKTADVDAVSSLQALLDRVRAGQGDIPPFLYASQDLWREEGVGIMMDYYDLCVRDWTKSDGTLEEKKLTEYFAAMTELDQQMKKHTPQSGQSSSALVTMTATTGGRLGFEEINMGSSSLKDGLAQFHTQEMSGIFALDFVTKNLSKLPDVTLSPLFGANAYTPKGGIGLNSAGTQQELAVSFLELLLSESVQDNYLYDGYPVNRKSLEKLITETLNADEGKGLSSASGDTAADAQEERNDMGFLRMCQALNTPLLSNQVVRDSVQAQMKGLLDGSVTPEEAAANVAEKTRLSLSE